MNASIEAAIRTKAADRTEKLAQTRLHLVNLLQHAEERLALAEQMHRGVDVQVKRVEEDLEGLAEERRLQKLYGGIEIEGTSDAEEEEEEEDKGKKRRATPGDVNRSKQRKTEAVPKPSTAQSPRRNPPVNSTTTDNANEPTYCICGQVSFGEMVACDDAACDVEWFHLDCVGLESPPQGKWYCSNCEARRLKNLTE